jgi:hypothetical protein
MTNILKLANELLQAIEEHSPDEFTGGQEDAGEFLFNALDTFVSLFETEA